MERKKRAEKNGQVSVFVIVALVLVAGTVLYFLFRGQISEQNIPQDLLPVFNYYSSCIEQEAGNAVGLMGTQGGHLTQVDYAPGSEYAPFSSHLNFLGFPVPYWYYVSGNGLIKEQVPSKSEMESQIADYVEEGLAFCDFESFYLQGFEAEVEDPIVKVVVKNNVVEVEVSAEMVVSKDDESTKRSTHKIDVNSKLGKFYELALEIYEEEKNEAFLEDYAVDVLYMYAPVDGLEIQCSPK